jgi:hypothetical protein
MDFPDPSNATVRVASSSSIATAAIGFKQAIQKRLKINDFKNPRNMILYVIFYKDEPNRFLT